MVFSIVTAERLQVSEAGAYKLKKMHRDPDPTNLTGNLTKRFTWTYIKILPHVLTITPKGWMSLYPSHAHKRHNVFTSTSFIYNSLIKLTGIERA